VSPLNIFWYVFLNDRAAALFTKWVCFLRAEAHEQIILLLMIRYVFLNRCSHKKPKLV